MRERIAIVGSRNFPDLDRVRAFVHELPEDAIVISGGASGVDTCAVGCAHVRGLLTEVYRADWRRLGRRAGFVRNEEIVKRCDRVVAFWDGVSRGTAHTIGLAAKYGKPCEVIRG